MTVSRSTGLPRHEMTFGKITLTADEALNDSDKTITVPSGEFWLFQSLRVELATTATATVRQLEVQVRDDADDVVFGMIPGVTQDASLTHHYHFAPHLADLSALRDTEFVMTPFPALWLLPLWDIRIFDNNAVDAAADDMVVQLITLVQG